MTGFLLFCGLVGLLAVLLWLNRPGKVLPQPWPPDVVVRITADTSGFEETGHGVLEAAEHFAASVEPYDSEADGWGS